MKIKTIRRLAVLLLAALLLVGCTPKEPEQTTSGPQQTQPSTHGTVPEHTDPQQTQPGPTKPTKPTEPPPSLEPLTVLRCTQWKTFPELLSLGGGLVLASRNYYSSQEKGIINSMELIDVYADEVVAAIENDSTREPVIQRFQDGAIVTADPGARKFYVYDKELKLLSSFSAPQVDGFFSHDRKNYYYVNSGVLYRMDVASGNRSRMSLEKDLHVESLLSIHDSQDLLVARVYLSFYTDSYGIAVIDGATGKLRLLREDLFHVWLSDDLFYAVETHDTIHGNDVFYGSLNGGEVKRISADAMGGDRYSYSVLPGSHYLLRRLAPDEGEHNTTVYDLANGGRGADLKKYGFEHAAAASVYLKDEQLIVGLCPNGFNYDMVRIDPKVLNYEGTLPAGNADWTERVDQKVLDAYHSEVVGETLPEGLNQVRSQADALEKKYGIKIRIGQQTKGASAQSGYTVAVDGDPQRIKAALDMLDKALAKYPQNFFAQFRNSAREGGLYVNLTGKIQNQLPTVGFAKLFRGRYELALDITAGELEKTLHHEIWHAIEMRVSTDTFNTSKWNKCNPSGFSYYGSYDKGYQDQTRWTYTGGSGANSYFVDPYSRINGREDRARIFEYVMSTDAADLVKSSAIKGKLKIMSDTIRANFDTDGWADVYWERYL